jgi:hypothetical protein
LEQYLLATSTINKTIGHYIYHWLSSTQQMSFYANYGYHPKFDMLNQSKNENPTADDFAARLLELHALIKVHLEEAQDRYEAGADKIRKESLSFLVGDKVSFIRRNIKTTKSCDKLDYC